MASVSPVSPVPLCLLCPQWNLWPLCPLCPCVPFSVEPVSPVAPVSPASLVSPVAPVLSGLVLPKEKESPNSECTNNHFDICAITDAIEIITKKVVLTRQFSHLTNDT